MNELKPCPFCGGEAEFLLNRTHFEGFDVAWEFAIRCKNCRVETPKTNYKLVINFGSDGRLNILVDGRKNATDDWNRRVDNE